MKIGDLVMTQRGSLGIVVSLSASTVFGEERLYKILVATDLGKNDYNFALASTLRKVNK